jgi:hypothetical protein
MARKANDKCVHRFSNPLPACGERVSRQLTGRVRGRGFATIDKGKMTEIGKRFGQCPEPRSGSIYQPRVGASRRLPSEKIKMEIPPTLNGLNNMLIRFCSNSGDWVHSELRLTHFAVSVE